MVAGDEHDLAPGADALAEVAQQRLGDGQRPGGRAPEQLDDVPEQNEPVDPLHRSEQTLAWARPFEHGMARASSEVKVGDEERVHAPPRYPCLAREPLREAGATAAARRDAGPAVALGRPREGRRVDSWALTR